MYARKIIISLLLSFVVIFTGCGHSESVKPVKSVGRTVLVYMVAANSLGQEYNFGGEIVPKADEADLEEMQEAARTFSFGNARLLVYHVTYNESKLLEVTPEGLSVLKLYPDAGYATSASTMTQVFDDMEALAPADKYGLVLWSHATGWLEDAEDDESRALAVPVKKTFGSHSGHKMNTTTLRSVLEPRGFDYIYFDCCLMGSIEVAYELRNCASTIVASASELPRAGQPYQMNVPLLLRGTRADLVNAARNTFELYATKADLEDRTATMAVIATEGLERVAQATADIYRLTETAHPLSRVTNYYGTDMVKEAYYLDFGEYVRAIAAEGELDTSLVREYDEAMAAAVIYHDATVSLWGIWDIYNSCGLSTRVFNNYEDISVKDYDHLDWTRRVVVQHFNH